MTAALGTWWRENSRAMRTVDIVFAVSTGVNVASTAGSARAHLPERGYWSDLGITQVTYAASLVMLVVAYATFRVLSHRYRRWLREIAGFRAGGACEKRTM